MKIFTVPFLSPAKLSIIIAIFLIFSATVADTQTALRRNVNIIGPTPESLIGDPGLKQQNEPSCGVRPDNPLYIFCGFNDYRGADLPAVGDAWMGAAMTANGGLTWNSRLVPGYPGDTPTVGQEFGADPTVIAAPGMVLYSFIAAGRDEHSRGGFFLQRWPEQTKEDAFGWIPADTQVIATGTPGRFVDKPDMKLNIGTAGETVPVTVDFANGDQRTITMPQADLLSVYTVFTGNSEITKLLFQRSTDYGTSWSKARKLSAGSHTNQGASIAANGDELMVVWRRFNRNSQDDAIMYAYSDDRGKSFDGPNVLTELPGSDGCPFDQGTTPVSFRTSALPVAVHDGSHFYAFFSARGHANSLNDCADDLARIVMTRMDGQAWTTPVAVDNPPGVAGHQVIPAAFAAEGVIQLTWYDTRNDQSGLSTPFINDVADPSGVILRRTADVRGLQIKNAVAGPSTQLSQYRRGKPPYLEHPIQLERSNINARIFKQGQVPFNGDYHAVTAPLLRQDNSGNWIANNGPSNDGSAPPFFVAWTDNRDVRGLIHAGVEQATTYTPGETAQSSAALTPVNEAQAAKSMAAVSEPDPSMVYPVCNPAEPRDRTRDQNVYFSAVYPGLLASSPTPGKKTLTPDGNLLQRAYVLYLQNTTSEDREFLLSIANQPDGGQASLRQTSLLEQIVVPIARRSSATRTLFVTSAESRPEVKVDIVETGIGAGTEPLNSVVRLNSNVQSPDIENPDYENPDIENEAFDILNVEVHNPDIENKYIAWYANPDIENPDIENPDIENPDIENPDFENPDIENPDLENFRIAYPDIENPDIENSNAAAYDGYTDVGWTIQNKGNTTTAYNLKPFLKVDSSDLEAQVIVTRSYYRETSQFCEQVRVVDNQVVLNVTGAEIGQDFANPDIENPTLSDASFFIEPGGAAVLTLRVWGTIDLQEHEAGLAVYSQACNTEGSCDESSLPKAVDDGTLFDATPPQFTLVPDDIEGIEATGPNGATVNFEVEAEDAVSGSVDVSCVPGSGSLFPLGNTLVSCSAADGNGNTAYAEFSVIVQDTTAPKLSLPETILVTPTNTGGTAIVNYDAHGVAATDLVDQNVELACVPASGSEFQGLTTVTCVAIDSSGNESVPGEFDVIVKFDDQLLTQFPASASPDIIIFGQSAELQWQFANGNGTAVESDFADSRIRIFRKDQCGGSSLNEEPVVDAADEELDYDGNDFTWGYNWNPGPTELGCYNILVNSRATTQEYGPFEIEVVLGLPTD